MPDDLADRRVEVPVGAFADFGGKGAGWAAVAGRGVTLIVVTGATGNVGRPLVTLLASAGETVTAVARRVTTADVAAGVRAVPADLADAESLRPALDGADGLFLCPAGELLGAAGDQA